MKAKIILLSIFSALMLLSSARLSAQIAPYYDVIGNLQLMRDGDVTRATIKSWQPYTFELKVPTDEAPSITGFNTGFMIVPSVNEHMVELDSIRITKCQYSIYHLDVLTGIETPVLYADGSSMTDIVVGTFSDETAGTNSLFTTTVSYWSDDGIITSTNGGAISASVQHVGAIFSTKRRIVWGLEPDLQAPALNKGYVIRWDIRFIPVYQGVEHPEVRLSPKFAYQVEKVPLPTLVSITSIRDVYDWDEDGTVLRMSGEQLEFFKLQRSADLINWTDWGYDGEGDNWVGPYTIPDSTNGGFWSNIHEWILFDPAFPMERRRPGKEFYRMVWTGKRGSWRQWSPNP